VTAKKTSIGRRPRGYVSVFVTDKPISRSVPDERERVVVHYAKDGSLARLDMSRKPPASTNDFAPGTVFMSMRNAAERLGSHPSTLRRAVANGSLRAVPIGDQWVTTPAWLDEYRRTRRRPGRPRSA
jgi:excisionase family DNA binding protein